MAQKILMRVKYIQVIPIIRPSTTYPNGKILLGKWKNGNYIGRYTGLIQRIETLAPTHSSLIQISKAILPPQINQFVTEAKIQGILEFDGPPPSTEYIVTVDIKNSLNIKSCFQPSVRSLPYELFWFDLNKIPFENMPEDDAIWYGPVIEGKKVQGIFNFGGENERTIKNYELKIVKNLKI